MFSGFQGFQDVTFNMNFRTRQHCGESTCFVHFLLQVTLKAGSSQRRFWFVLHVMTKRSHRPISSQFTLTFWVTLVTRPVKRVKGNTLYSLYAVTIVWVQEITTRSVNTAGVTGVIFGRERAVIGLVLPPLPCRTPAVCPSWKHTSVYIPVGWHHWTPVPCFSQKGTLVAHLPSTYLSKLSLYPL